MRPAFQIIPALVLGAVLLPPATAAGQTVPSAYTYITTKQEFGPFVGYMNGQTGRFGFGPSGGLMYGGRYGVQLGGPMSLEGVGGVISGTRDVVDPSRAEGDRVVGQGDVRLTTLDVRLKFSATGDRAWHSLSPFLALGAGVAFDLADAAPADTLLESRDVFKFGTSFLGSVGIGTRWFVTDHLTTRTDGTFSLWKLKTPAGFSDPDRGIPLVDTSEWVRGLSISVSLLYSW